MSNKDEPKNKSLNQILNDIEGHIEKANASSNKDLTPEQLSSVRESFKYQKSQDKPALHPFWIFIVVLLIVGIIFFVKIIFTSKAPEFTVVQQKKTIDHMAPASSETGDIFKKERGAFEQGRKKLSSGNYDGIKDIDNLVKNSPKSPQAAKALLVMAATYRYNLNESGKAIENYEKFLKLFPNHKRSNITRRYLIEMLFDQGEYKKVEFYIKELLNYSKSESDIQFTDYFLKKIH